MKRKTLLVILSLLLSSVLIIGTTKLIVSPSKAKEPDHVQVVTSFYPVYICALNLTQNTSVDLKNLTEPTGGCLHDYQLRPQDLVALEGADLFVINGGGMESFLDSVIANYPDLAITDCSTGMELLPSEHEHGAGHEHLHEENHTHEGEYNAHLWLSPTRYLQQIDTVYEALCDLVPGETAQFTENRDTYRSKILSLQKEMHQSLATADHRDVVIFHDSFAYFAEEFGWHIVECIPLESDTALSAGEIAALVDAVKATGTETLLCEEQYSPLLAQAIAAETDASLYILDPCVRGEYHPDAYLNAMRQNLSQLQTAFAQ